MVKNSWNLGPEDLLQGELECQWLRLPVRAPPRLVGAGSIYGRANMREKKYGPVKEIRQKKTLPGCLATDFQNKVAMRRLEKWVWFYEMATLP